MTHLPTRLIGALNSREFQERLARRGRRVGVTLSSDLSAQLEAYYRLLSAWNRKINLTGLDLAEPTPEAVDESHDLSLAASPDAVDR